jgi:hypothetical protein
MTLKERLKNLLQTFSQETLEDGTVIEVDEVKEGETVEVVTEEGNVDAPDGEQKLEDGTVIVTEDSVIVEVKEEELIEEVKEELKFEVTEEDYSNLVSALEMLKSELETVKSEFESVKSQIEELIKTPASESPAESIKKEEFIKHNPYMEYYNKLDKLKKVK